jgi:hypothetical protein
MKLAAKLNALPFFWKAYIVCMTFAAFRMGDPEWEWTSSSLQSCLAATVSERKTPIQEAEPIAAQTGNIPH